MTIEFAPELEGVHSLVTTAPIETFVTLTEASAEALLGTDDDTVLAAGGTGMWFGEGGSGKTTMEIDAAFHLAAGIPWLGLHVPRRARGLLLEAEGPRGKMRMKLAAKLARWQGPDVSGWLHIVESPWATLSLADAEHRAGIARAMRDTDTEILYAGPVAALGLEGGGTPAEVRTFVAHLEDVREQVGRSVAFWLIAHTNKGGQVSGAWDGATDTLAHVQSQGNGHTRLYWQKTRWAPSHHGTTWHLLWRDGQGFEVEDKPQVTEDTIAADIFRAVREIPGGSWSKIRERVTGKATEVANVRDRLIAEGAIVNTAAREGNFNLWDTDDPAVTRSHAGTGRERPSFPSPDGTPQPTRSPFPPIGNGYGNGPGGPGRAEPEQLDGYEQIAGTLLPGDDGYLERLSAAFLADHVSEGELRELKQAHRLVVARASVR